MRTSLSSSSSSFASSACCCRAIHIRCTLALATEIASALCLPLRLTDPNATTALRFALTLFTAICHT